MQAIEEFLSPLTQKRTYSYSDLLVSDSGFAVKEKKFIENIRTIKEKIIHRELFPCDIDLVKPEIIESWLRSYDHGLDYNGFLAGKLLSKQIFEKKIEQNKGILNIVDMYLSYLKDLLSINCTILYSDNKGIVYRLLEKSIDNKYKEPYMVVGSIWDEENCGTCSHVLTHAHKKPFQLSGPEHYCDYGDEMIASTAPIFDVNSNLRGSITIASMDNTYQNQDTLGVAMSIAWGIQNRLVIEEKVTLLNDSTANCVDGMIFINNSGKITKANIIAEKIFHDLNQPLPGQQMESLFADCSAIRSVLYSGKEANGVLVDIPSCNFSLRLQSICPTQTSFGKISGCCLTIKKCTGGKQRSTSIVSPSNNTKFSFGNLIGKSPRMLETIEKAKKFASINANILIEGESGTGKEVFAQSIHNASRPEGAFIAVNCAAIPQNLIESELFGYRGGAFTGAEKRGRVGKIELAEGGTLFLDEIGDMPLALQPVLLRALEEKKIMRVGDSRYISVNFNLIAATNKDLKQLVKEKLFRADLYYRLAVLKIVIPPLRDRGADIVRLAKFFMRKICRQGCRENFRLSDEVASLLLKFTWPGNVRQLESTIFYSVNMSSSGLISCDSLPEEINVDNVMEESGGTGKLIEDPIDDDGTGMTIKDLEKVTIIQTLEDTNGSVNKAASILGLCKSTLYRKIKKYNITV